MLRYRNLDIQAPEYEPLSYYSSDTDQDLAAWLANLGTGTAAGAEAAAHEVPSADEEAYLLERRHRPVSPSKAVAIAAVRRSRGRDGASGRPPAVTSYT